MAPTKDVVVVGAGVIGLSCAVLLAEAGYRVKVVAKHLPGDICSEYTSAQAGAHYRPVPDVTAQEKDQADLCIATYNEFHRLVITEQGCGGVVFMQGIEYIEDPSQKYTELKGRYAVRSDFSLIHSDKLPPGFKFGSKYLTYCVDPSVYLSYLVTRLEKARGAIDRREVPSLEAAFDNAHINTVINCTGTGYDDADTYGIQGQTVLMRSNKSVKYTATAQFKDGSWSFIVPRHDRYVVVGGTKVVIPKSSSHVGKACAETRALLLERARTLFPDVLKDAVFVRDVIGVRPFRHAGPRIEIEHTPSGRVCHAYGAGGSGYEMSWGIAFKVLTLVLQQDENI